MRETEKEKRTKDIDIGGEKETKEGEDTEREGE